MNESAINDYISRLKHSSDEDAFHFLIEAGEAAVAPVSAAITADSSVVQFRRLVEVLQEIRTKSALTELKDLCLMSFSEKWVLAAEALFYNNPNAACRILDELLVQASPADREAKSKLVSELAASLEPPDSSATPA